MKFSIRDLFLVTLIVALAVGWFVEHRKLIGLEAEVNSLRPHAEEWRRNNKKMLHYLTELDKKMKQLGPAPSATRIDSELFRKLADEARDKYGVP